MIKSKDHFGTELEAGREWVRMDKKYKCHTLMVDSRGGGRKSPFLFLADEFADK